MPFNLFGIGSKPKVKASTMIYLTDVGKRYAEKYATSGATYLITAQLNEKSPQTVTEIARETSMDIDELKKRIEELAKEGVVRIGGGEG